jgi:hypothetical protein
MKKLCFTALAIFLIAMAGCSKPGDAGGDKAPGGGDASAASGSKSADPGAGDSTATAFVAPVVTPAMKPVVGELMPEIEGTDTDGTRFSLGDYRGKVVMLDFWGDW